MSITQKFANYMGYSDVRPYEIVRVISERTIEIREMKAAPGEWKQDFRPGGFFGTVVNQHDQKWVITSDPAAEVIRIRLSKKRGWRDKGGGHYELADEPRKFYDYNF